jgi:hypothetical protein
MRKTRLYLEASPIIRVDDSNSPIRQAITKEFFLFVTEKSDEYELFISPVAIGEIDTAKTTEEKRKTATDFLKTIQYTQLLPSSEVENLAWTYVTNDVLSEKHIDDLTHVAYAVVSRCDYIITWNMRHLANEQTVRHVNMVNSQENYGKIFITTPEFFTGGKIYGK